MLDLLGPVRELTGSALLLGLQNLDLVGQADLRSCSASRVVSQHDRHLDTEHSLAEENVANGAVDVVLDGVSGLDHVSFPELHGLGTLATELSGNDDLASRGSGLHDEAEDSVASAANSEASKQLVLEGLGLGLGAEAAELEALSVELDGAVGHVEALLNSRGELADAASLVSQHVLSAGGTDNNLSAERGLADLNSGIALSGQLVGEELVQFGLEHSIVHELSLLGHLNRRHFYSGESLLVSRQFPSSL